MKNLVASPAAAQKRSSRSRLSLGRFAQASIARAAVDLMGIRLAESSERGSAPPVNEAPDPQTSDPAENQDGEIGLGDDGGRKTQEQTEEQAQGPARP